jgi:hypothetical protein
MGYSVCIRCRGFCWKPLGPPPGGFLVSVDSRRTPEGLHSGVNLVEVDPDEAAAASVSDQPAVGDHLSDRAVSDAEVLGRIGKFGVSPLNYRMN